MTKKLEARTDNNHRVIAILPPTEKGLILPKYRLQDNSDYIMLGFEGSTLMGGIIDVSVPIPAPKPEMPLSEHLANIACLFLEAAERTRQKIEATEGALPDVLDEVTIPRDEIDEVDVDEMHELGEGGEPSDD